MALRDRVRHGMNFTTPTRAKKTLLCPIGPGACINVFCLPIGNRWVCARTDAALRGAALVGNPGLPVVQRIRSVPLRYNKDSSWYPAVTDANLAPQTGDYIVYYGGSQGWMFHEGAGTSMPVTVLEVQYGGPTGLQVRVSQNMTYGAQAPSGAGRYKSGAVRLARPGAY